MKEIQPIGEPASVGTLVARALQILQRYWIVFATTGAAVVLCEGAIHVFVRIAHMDELAELVLPQIIVATVYAFAGSDVAKQPQRSEVWTRILERIWAVVVLNVAFELLLLFSLGAIGTVDAGGGVQMFFMQLAVMLIMVLVAFADVIAVVQPNLRMRDVLPFSIVRSARLVANTLVWMRVLGLLIADYVIGTAAAAGTQAISGAGMRTLAFWAYAGTNALITIVLAAFLALLYFDADLRDRIAKRDRGG